jgi:hypothetical protein
MTGVVFSCNYGGKAFVCAEFGTERFLYYDGAIVEQSWEGVILAGRTGLATLGTDLERVIERETEDDDGNATWRVTANDTTAGRDLVYSPSGVSFRALTSQESVDGLMGQDTLSHDVAAVVGAQAYASVEFTATDGATFTVTVPEKADGTGTYIIADGIVGTAVIADTIDLIVTAINDLTPTTGYSAKRETTNLIVFAPLDFGAVTFDLTVDWTGAGGAGDGTYADALRIELVAPLYMRLPPSSFAAGRTLFLDTSGKISISGGTGVYNNTPPTGCTWTRLSSTSEIAISDTTVPYPVFSAFVPNRSTISESFRLSIVDGITVTLDVTVVLSCEKLGW